MLGLVTQYRKHDNTLAALTIASHLTTIATPYTLAAYDWCATNIDPRFDKACKKIKFRQLLSMVRMLVLTAPIAPYFVRLAKQYNVGLVLYTGWDQFQAEDAEVLADYTYVLLPSYQQAVRVQDRFKLHNVAVLPYAPMWPITIKQQKQIKQLRVFLSLYGSQRERVDHAAVVGLCDLLNKKDNVDITIACGGGITSGTHKLLRASKARHPTRVTILRQCNWIEHTLQISKHDLTILPAVCDGYGLIALTSLTAGTPVLSWNICPTNEYLGHMRNALLVNCDVTYTGDGAATAVPDYTHYYSQLEHLIDNPAIVTQLSRYTSDSLVNRYTEFCTGWHNILSNVN